MTAEIQIDAVDPPLTSAPVEFPPDTSPDLSVPVVTESVIIAEMRETIERLKAKVARYEDPLAERFERLKNAVLDSGVARQTLMNWVRDKLVNHYYDGPDEDHLTLWIDVIHARALRFAFAPTMGRNGP
ncbi:hypothetical protein [Bradyrhizobium erythrophlei]|uniref:Uncharacterized protein n=1 Tax=Bradyrhizobium erythrophlei TaxID=1437360 RepID=A0A1M5MVV5_9BRAD|nr:hypothetical protein [Bradyrhizobium erythrophlei]SHG80893.1 hypothetical protein SAMN05443248_2729 [Bradyrhizobium erythrophlei]